MFLVVALRIVLWKCLTCHCLLIAAWWDKLDLIFREGRRSIGAPLGTSSLHLNWETAAVGSWFDLGASLKGGRSSWGEKCWPAWFSKLPWVSTQQNTRCRVSFKLSPGAAFSAKLLLFSVCCVLCVSFLKDPESITHGTVANQFVGQQAKALRYGNSLQKRRDLWSYQSVPSLYDRYKRVKRGPCISWMTISVTDL